MRAFAVSAIGRDRPGIIAAVTEVLADFALAVQDGQGSLLRGHFALTLVVRGGDHVEPGDLEHALAPVRERLGLEAVTVCELDPDAREESAPSDATHLVAVDCRERPGIAHAVCATVAGAGASVVGLTGGSEELRLSLSVPDDGRRELEDRLDAIAAHAEAPIRLEPLLGSRR